MKLFELHRVEDESGVSGVGVVAQGVIFDSGWCALTWLTPHSSVAVYTSIEEVEAIHGHEGKTKVVMLTSVMEESLQQHAAALDSMKNVAGDLRRWLLFWSGVMRQNALDPWAERMIEQAGPEIRVEL